MVLRLLCAAVLAGILAASGYAQAPVPGDTLLVPAYGVVFFQPSDAERDSLNTFRLFELDSLQQTFERNRRGVLPFFSKCGLPHVLTSAVTIAGGHDGIPIHIRRPYADLFGVILCAPGRSPLLLEGVQSESSILSAVMRFYGIGRK